MICRFILKLVLNVISGTITSNKCTFFLFSRLIDRDIEKHRHIGISFQVIRNQQFQAILVRVTFYCSLAVQFDLLMNGQFLCWLCLDIGFHKTQLIAHNVSDYNQLTYREYITRCFELDFVLIYMHMCW